MQGVTRVSVMILSAYFSLHCVCLSRRTGQWSITHSVGTHMRMFFIASTHRIDVSLDRWICCCGDTRNERSFSSCGDTIQRYSDTRATIEIQGWSLLDPHAWIYSLHAHQDPLFRDSTIRGRRSVFGFFVLFYLARRE